MVERLYDFGGKRKKKKQNGSSVGGVEEKSIGKIQVRTECVINQVIYPIEGKCDKKILIVNYKTDLWAKFSVFNCIDNGKKNYDVRGKSILEYYFFPLLHFQMLFDWETVIGWIWRISCQCRGEIEDAVL